MAFGYTKATISGTPVGVDGPIKFIQDVASFMVNTLGWTQVEDRTTTAGATKQLILSSTGEDSRASTFYFVLSSGNTVGVTGGVGCQAATAWDTTTHAVAATGVITPSATGTSTIAVYRSILFDYWVSGDKDSVVIVTKTNGNYDAAYVGRVRQITDPARDTFPVYVVGNNSKSTTAVADTSANAYSFSAPNHALTAGSTAPFNSFFPTPLDSNETPQNIFGTTEGVVCLPNIASVASGTAKATRGFSLNLWTTAGPATGNTSMAPEDILDPGTGKTYQVFFTDDTDTAAIVIRRT